MPSGPFQNSPPLQADVAEIGALRKKLLRPQGRKIAGGLLEDLVHQMLAPDVINWNLVPSACEKGVILKRALGLLLEIY